jgi:hypothetical protein
MKTTVETIWRELIDTSERRPVGADKFILRRIDPAAEIDIYAGIDATANRMLAVGVGERPPMIKLDSTALDYFRQQRSSGQWLMALRLKQPALAEVFGQLCQDLIDATADVTGAANLIALVQARLELWMKLFANGHTGLLEPYQMKGLVAELLVFDSMLQGGVRSQLEIAHAWVGPLGADQDFVFSDEAIEVKAIGPSSEVVSISSLQQLDCVVPLRLSVQTLRPASPDDDKAVSLNTIALRIEGQLASTPDALSLFRRRLLEAGYVECPYYDTVRFEVSAGEWFTVGERFPRLIAATVPDGIASASYAVSMTRIRQRD